MNRLDNGFDPKVNWRLVLTVQINHAIVGISDSKSDSYCMSYTVGMELEKSKSRTIWSFNGGKFEHSRAHNGNSFPTWTGDFQLHIGIPNIISESSTHPEENNHSCIEQTGLLAYNLGKGEIGPQFKIKNL